MPQAEQQTRQPDRTNPTLPREGPGASEASQPGACPIVTAGEDHVDGIVSCQREAYGGELSTLLGESFLNRYYRFFLAHPRGICLVAVDLPARKVTGFVVGGDSSLPRHFLLRHPVCVLAAVMLKAWTSSYVRKRILQIFGETVQSTASRLASLFRGVGPPHPERSKGQCSKLMLICTHPGHRGRQLGQSLLQAFREESYRLGYSEMTLTVERNNERALRLYRKDGWTPVGESSILIHMRRAVRG